MRFTSESIMHDIQVHLDERKDEPWTYVDRLLLKAQLHILGMKRELDELRKVEEK